MFSDEPTVDLDKDDEIIALLAERWPRCFMLAEDRRLPLAARASRLPNEGSRKPPSKGALAPHYCR